MLVHNTIRTLAYERVRKLDPMVVTDQMIDEMQDEAKAFLNSQGINIGRTRTREILVDYIIREFGIKVFGVKPVRDEHEISDKTVKKYQRLRKKGF